jgi:serine protease
MGRAFRVAVVVAASVSAGVTARSADLLRALSNAQSSPTVSGHRPGEVIVAFREGADQRIEESAFRAVGVREARRGLGGRRYLVRLDPDRSVDRTVAELGRMAQVDYAEANGVMRMQQAATFTPNDRFYPLQWNLKMLNAERTWGIQKGVRSVGVAVLDTGVAYEDYRDPRTGKLYRKGLDWGDLVFLPGRDVVNGDDHPNDDNYHGTSVAAVIAEATNNGIDFAGLAFGVSIMPVKVLDDTGEGDYFDVAEGINYAASFTQDGRRPVKVINLSLGSDGFSEDVKRAVDLAVRNGVLVVASSGNDGLGRVSFPATLPTVLAVGAVDAVKGRAPYSNWGPELDLVAPGGNCSRDDNVDGRPDCIFTNFLDPQFSEAGDYTRFCTCGIDGTSAAAPHVSATAALLFSQGFDDPAAVRAALEQTAERLGGAPADGRNDQFGHGLIRPPAALAGLGLNKGPEKK